MFLADVKMRRLLGNRLQSSQRAAPPSAQANSTSSRTFGWCGKPVCYCLCRSEAPGAEGLPLRPTAQPQGLPAAEAAKDVCWLWLEEGHGDMYQKPAHRGHLQELKQFTGPQPKRLWGQVADVKSGVEAIVKTRCAISSGQEREISSKQGDVAAQSSQLKELARYLAWREETWEGRGWYWGDHPNIDGGSAPRTAAAPGGAPELPQTSQGSFSWGTSVALNQFNSQLIKMVHVCIWVGNSFVFALYTSSCSSCDLVQQFRTPCIVRCCLLCWAGTQLFSLERETSAPWEEKAAQLQEHRNSQENVENGLEKLFVF